MTLATTHTSSECWKYTIETNYAGGSAGAEYALTAPIYAALVACNQPYNETQTMPWGAYEKVAEASAGQGASTKITFTKSYKVRDGKISQYMQNATWLDLAIADAAGSLPSSFLIHWAEGQNQYTSYGCYISEYKLTGPKDDYLREELTIKAYCTVDEDVGSWAVSWNATAVANFQDIGTGGTYAAPKIKITTTGATVYPIVVLEDVAVTITNNYREGGQAGSYYAQFPYLETRECEIEMTHLDYIATLIAEQSVYAAATDLVTILFDDLGKAGFSATNMKIKPETINVAENPEKGMKRYKATWEIGGACVLTTP